MKFGLEDPELGMNATGLRKKAPGRVTQAVTSEHLSHVIFGHHDLQLAHPSMEILCSQFLPNTTCPESPCRIGGKTIEIKRIHTSDILLEPVTREVGLLSSIKSCLIVDFGSQMVTN